MGAPTTAATRQGHRLSCWHNLTAKQCTLCAPGTSPTRRFMLSYALSHTLSVWLWFKESVYSVEGAYGKGFPILLSSSFLSSVSSRWKRFAAATRLSFSLLSFCFRRNEEDANLFYLNLERQRLLSWSIEQHNQFVTTSLIIQENISIFGKTVSNICCHSRSNHRNFSQPNWNLFGQLMLPSIGPKSFRITLTFHNGPWSFSDRFVIKRNRLLLSSDVPTISRVLFSPIRVC